MTLIADALLATAAAFILLSIVIVYRIVRGPTMQDRIVGANVIGTHAVIVIAIAAAYTGNQGLLDIALVYALLNFLMSIAISKFTVERGGVI